MSPRPRVSAARAGVGAPEEAQIGLGAAGSARTNPSCACCGDARTRWLCPTCVEFNRKNGIVWVEADDAETSWATPPDDRGVLNLAPDAGEERVWNPTPLQRAVLRLAVEGGDRATVAGIARVTGSSVQYVRRVLKEFNLQSVSAARRA